MLGGKLKQIESETQIDSGCLAACLKNTGLPIQHNAFAFFVFRTVDIY